MGHSGQPKREGVPFRKSSKYLRPATPPASGGLAAIGKGLDSRDQKG
jgi:hypothetical protein